MNRSESQEDGGWEDEDEDEDDESWTEFDSAEEAALAERLLTFLRDGDQQTAIWRCVAHDGSIVQRSAVTRQSPRAGIGHI